MLETQNLVSLGWVQGSLFSDVGRAVMTKSGSGAWLPSHAGASEDQLLLVASQTCDIKSDSEEYLEAICCKWFPLQASEVTGARKGNSRRYFLVAQEKTRALIAIASDRVIIDKAALVDTPLVHFDHPDDYESWTRNLGRWLGGRYARKALSDDVVRCVQVPIVEAVVKSNKGSEGGVESVLREIRIAPVYGEPPYQVAVLLLIDGKASEDDPRVARFVAELAKKLSSNDSCARLIDFGVVTADQLSVADYENTWRMPLDYMTSGGLEVPGLFPVQGIDTEQL